MALTGLPGSSDFHLHCYTITVLLPIADWEAVDDSDLTLTDTESDSVSTDGSSSDGHVTNIEPRSIPSSRLTGDCQEISEEVEETVEDDIARQPSSPPAVSVLTSNSSVERVSSPSKKAGERSRPSSHISHCSSCMRSRTPTRDEIVPPARLHRSKLFVQRGRGSRIATGVNSRTRLKTSNIDLVLNAGALPAVSPGLVTSPGVIPGQPDSVKVRSKTQVGYQMTCRSPTKQRFHLEMYGKQMESSLRGAPGSTSMPSMSDTPSVEAEQKRPSTMSSGEVRRPIASLATEYVGTGLNQWSRNASVAMGLPTVSSARRRPSRRGGLSKPRVGDDWMDQKREGLLVQSMVGRDVDMRRKSRRATGSSRLMASARTLPSYGKS